MTGKTLKYLRTTQGFVAWPPLAGIHKEVAKAIAWPVRSVGFVDWEFDGRPICMGESDSLGLKALPEDTELLRAEWGMTAPAAPALSPAAEAAAREFGAGLEPVANPEGVPA